MYNKNDQQTPQIHKLKKNVDIKITASNLTKRKDNIDKINVSPSPLKKSQ
jgi:hypothetical protein